AAHADLCLRLAAAFFNGIRQERTFAARPKADPTKTRRFFGLYAALTPQAESPSRALTAIGSTL
ncbi:MAG: hypothetical protein ABI655_10555, partial [Phenylobacterium sp.]